jgi:Na+-transporting methylmalonyl-CoA/oxaloacetate decarboxylase gamma subunit
MNQRVNKSVIKTSIFLISGVVLLVIVLSMVANFIGIIGKVTPDNRLVKESAKVERIKPVAQIP